MLSQLLGGSDIPFVESAAGDFFGVSCRIVGFIICCSFVAALTCTFAQSHTGDHGIHKDAQLRPFLKTHTISRGLAHRAQKQRALSSTAAQIARTRDAVLKQLPDTLQNELFPELYMRHLWRHSPSSYVVRDCE